MSLDVANCVTDAYPRLGAALTTYGTGTLTATNGSKTITGSGTVWTTDMVGGWILIGSVYYVIASVASSTSAALTANFGETTGGSKAYLVSYAWVNPAELLQFAEDEAKKLARDVGLMVVYDTSVSVIAGTASYNLPATHVFTIMAVLIPASGPVQFLRLTSARDLWALDGNWTTTVGDAVRASLDAGAVGTMTLYPNPLTNSTLGLVCQESASTLQTGATTISLPTVLQDLFTYAMLAGARGKESDHYMPDMAQHFRARVDLYEQVCGHLWGSGQ